MEKAADSWPRSVLVVDDEPTILKLFGIALEQGGFEMRAAPDAEAGLECIDEQPFACLIADKNLPGMDGVELVRLVGQRQPFCACIIMTGHPSLDSAVEALRLGAVDYLLKPFDHIGLVIEKVRNAIAHQRAVYGSQVLGRRVAAIRQDLTQRDTRLAQMREEIDHLSEVIAVHADTTSTVATLSPADNQKALEVTINLARALLTYTSHLVSILNASPLKDEDSSYVESFTSAATRLDAHLDTVEFLRQKT